MSTIDGPAIDRPTIDRKFYHRSIDHRPSAGTKSLCSWGSFGTLVKLLNVVFASFDATWNIILKIFFLISKSKKCEELLTDLTDSKQKLEIHENDKENLIVNMNSLEEKLKDRENDGQKEFHNLQSSNIEVLFFFLRFFNF